jgi:phosphogluconate dehydratase
MSLHPVVERVTARIMERSSATRADYLARMDAARDGGPARSRLSCGNLAHGFAASGSDKPMLRGGAAATLPSSPPTTTCSRAPAAGALPDADPQAARNAGGAAQVAGGVPAMCDGVTQGRAGMELSLFSRDVIAMATASRCRTRCSTALLLGVCDKIVPGLLIGALASATCRRSSCPPGR